MKKTITLLLLLFLTFSLLPCAAQETSPAPVCVVSYLPAPGQFVNQEPYRDVQRTLNGTGLITLGSFGGSIVYRFDEPIEDDPCHPYGVDFIVYGNCFLNQDGTTSAGAAEPAAVMVSEDGMTWYELAGSEYDISGARHGTAVTYYNSDPTFETAVDITWTDSDGNEGVLPINAYHQNPYYPDPAYYGAFQTDIAKNESYTKETVTYSGTMIEKGFYPFGYADSHSESASMGDLAANPYEPHHEQYFNGDGFDLAWAVDGQGEPVALSSVRYVKIYNPVLAYHEMTGEKSPEIKAIFPAKAADAEVGKSAGLVSLSVNGTEVPLQEDVYAYTVSADGASTYTIVPTAQDPNAHIYVSNRYVASGDTAPAIAAVDKLRVIVQEDEKEPVIYRLSFTDPETVSSHADLLSLTVSPNDAEVPIDGDTLSVTVDHSVSSVHITPTLISDAATLTVTGGKLPDPVTLLSGATSNALSLSVGTNVFELLVTSADETETRLYRLTVERASSGAGGGSGGGTQTITVSFSLIGDTHHGENGEHITQTWIEKTKVSVPKGSTVRYLTEQMLDEYGLSYITDGVYLSEINGLAEFDNGRNSGWEYRCNGKIAQEGYSVKKLSDGDAIVWFYTDDYTKETGYEGGWDSVNSSSGKSSGKSSDKPAEKPADPALADAEEPKTDVVPALPFTDVPQDMWYYDAVSFAYQNGLMRGVLGTVFAPNETVTRAMIVTILYRMEKSPAVQNKCPFADVATGSWYRDAVAWAAQEKIVSGISETEFFPDLPLTREQLAVLLYRYAALKEQTAPVSGDLSAFYDSERVKNWAEEAMIWATHVSLIQGTDPTHLSPDETASRAQIAAILMRLHVMMSTEEQSQ